MAEQKFSGNLNEGELDVFLLQYPRKPFDWSENHCARFAGAWANRWTGVDYLIGWDPTPGASARSQYRKVKKLGGDLSSLVSQVLGVIPQSAVFAQFGDIVFVPARNERGSLGICNGRTSIFLSPEGGFNQIPTSSATLAWRIPRG